MARKKTIKDVEAEEKVKNTKEKETEVEETEVEEVEEVEETETEEFEDEEKFEVEDEDEVEEEKKEEKKNKKEKKEKKQTKKDGYFKQVNKELKKVVWPKGGDIVKYSFAVIIFCIVLCLFFVGIDLIASFVKGLFV